ncbi:MAG: argininosuccinate lyase [Eubacteriaceae bacterium]|jgi:argininosuccinate lyase
MSKLWGGRFSKNTDKLTDDFNASIFFDQRLYEQDIQGSIAHARMLGRQGILSEEESALIIKTLEEILQDIKDGKVQFSEDNEDIHMNIESILTDRIGAPGKKLHTGRSRNDQVATDMKLWTREACVDLIEDISELERVVLDLAQKNLETIMPGYTHLQRAQPITYAHYLMAYVEMFSRDVVRFNQVIAMAGSSPLGSGALAGTTYPIDRYMTAEELGFKGVSLNTIDGVSDRDYAVDFLEACAVAMMHLSRFSEEIILYNSAEFGFITLDDAFTTGSSIMPQKKNPDIAELVRGKTGRCYGNLMALLTTMKGIPLAYNKDMQEDKEPVFDSFDTLSICLKTFTGMIRTIKVNKDRMLEAAKGGFSNATDAADWLVAHGIPFRDAHAIVGQLVMKAEQEGKKLEELSLEEMREVSPVFDESVYNALDIRNGVSKRRTPGGPSQAIVNRAIAIHKGQLEKNKTKQGPKE